MKILVYGAGVLGSRYAAGLHNAGHAVSILARGERLIQLREHGIVLEDINTGKITIAHINVVEKLEPQDEYDLVLVMMRSNQVESVLPAIAANQHIPSILFLGNNVAGAGEMVQALGQERVLMGFAAAAGVRDGHVIRYIGVTKGDEGYTYAGELDGRNTRRLQEITEAFHSSGFPVKIEPNMDAWHKTHVALVSPLAYAVYMAGGDNYRLACTRDALVLMVRAIRESFQALRAHGIQITPALFTVFERLPEPILVVMAKLIMNSKRAEIGIAGHANAARDEMLHLAVGFQELVRSGSVSTPSLDVLYTYSNPSQPPIAEGSSSMPVNMDGIWIVFGILTGVLTLLGLGFYRLIKCLKKRRKLGGES